MGLRDDAANYAVSLGAATAKGVNINAAVKTIIITKRVVCFITAQSGLFQRGTSLTLISLHKLSDT